jgi:hypothetical protein
VKEYTLVRWKQNDQVTLGKLMRTDTDMLCFTLELPWRNNANNISCIPLGSYVCKKIVSPKFGDTFEIKDVPKRDHVLIHAGNTVADTHGCILVGTGMRTDGIGIINSRMALKRLLEISDDIIKLNIVSQN